MFTQLESIWGSPLSPPKDVQHQTELGNEGSWPLKSAMD